ncbi:MAG: helix-turn-helix domain-containing protein [Gammaproteobacteria bacterium]|nr:helix-turn-helix domain-containing protein [Gammaproteobacteria bacterium]
MQKAVLSEKEAAAYIGMSVAFLQKDRMNGKLSGRTPGPRWIKVGRRVLYLKADLDQWLQEHIVQRSDYRTFRTNEQKILN